MNDMIKIVLIVALIVAIVIFGPLITIWSLNTIFPALVIPSNIATWFAVLWLGAFVTLKGKK